MHHDLRPVILDCGAVASAFAASLYHTQGRYPEAEPLYERSLAILEKVLGPEHPHVAAVINNLA